MSVRVPSPARVWAIPCSSGSGPLTGIGRPHLRRGRNLDSDIVDMLGVRVRTSRASVRPTPPGGRNLSTEIRSRILCASNLETVVEPPAWIGSTLSGDRFEGTASSPRSIRWHGPPVLGARRGGVDGGGEHRAREPAGGPGESARHHVHPRIRGLRSPQPGRRRACRPARGLRDPADAARPSMTVRRSPSAAARDALPRLLQPRRRRGRAGGVECGPGSGAEVVANPIVRVLATVAPGSGPPTIATSSVCEQNRKRPRQESNPQSAA